MPRIVSISKFLMFASLWFGAVDVSTLNATIGPVIGVIDGVFGAWNDQYIQGWACEVNNPNPLTINIYTGGGAGTGQLYSGNIANASPGDTGVSASCGTTTGHRFFVNATGDMFIRSGQPIYIYGIAQTAGNNNALLTNSGNFTVPDATVRGNLDSSTTGGVATGWAFDYLSTSASINVAIYADGNPLQGAETGTLVYEGATNMPRPDVNTTSGITGTHGFSVQLPAWVTQGVHTISVYPISVNGGPGGALTGTPTVPGASSLPIQFSFTSTVGDDFPTLWKGFRLPWSPNALVSITGTVSVNNSSNIYSEMLFFIQSEPWITQTNPICAISENAPEFGPDGPTLWTDIVKTPNAGVFTTPVNFTLPVYEYASSCLAVGINGGTPAAAHTVTGTVNLTVSWVPYVLGAATLGETLGVGGEVAPLSSNNGEKYARITTPSSNVPLALNAIYGNISDSTFDAAFDQNVPTGSWTANNDIYIYRGTESCQSITSNTSIPYNVNTGYYGPYNFVVPSTATHVLSVPLGGNGGPTPAQTINYLQPGFTNGTPVYQAFSNVTVNPGDCFVTFFGFTGNGEIDSEMQTTAELTAQ